MTCGNAHSDPRQTRPLAGNLRSLLATLTRLAKPKRPSSAQITTARGNGDGCNGAQTMGVQSCQSSCDTATTATLTRAPTMAQRNALAAKYHQTRSHADLHRLRDVTRAILRKGV
jgi:pectin methylesterase-like acyl-CoA thioesterase